MLTRTRPRHSFRQRGYTLLELLLTLVVLLLFLGAIALEFSALASGSELAEGERRLESLLRFARAESARRGSRVRVQFLPSASSFDDVDPTPAGETLYRRVRVEIEVDALGKPGVYRALPSLETERGLDRLVRMYDVRVVANSLSPPSANPMVALDQEMTPEVGADAVTIHFYPDGTCDGAELVLQSVDESDPERSVLRLASSTGFVSFESWEDPVANGYDFDVSTLDVSPGELNP
ncbi:MAG: prepilin-type N-terminal cleavage/methylation domain-containing protein [Planctomycetota bacterium]